MVWLQGIKALPNSITSGILGMVNSLNSKIAGSYPLVLVPVLFTIAPSTAIPV
jgi:hypothetical protein